MNFKMMSCDVIEYFEDTCFKNAIEVDVIEPFCHRTSPIEVNGTFLSFYDVIEVFLGFHNVTGHYKP